jgi:hypothetical protein
MSVRLNHEAFGTYKTTNERKRTLYSTCSYWHGALHELALKEIRNMPPVLIAAWAAKMAENPKPRIISFSTKAYLRPITRGQIL